MGAKWLGRAKLSRQLGSTLKIQLWRYMSIILGEPSWLLALFRCPGLTLTPSYNSAVSTTIVGSCIQSLAEGVGVDRRTTSLRLVWYKPPTQGGLSAGT